MHRELRSWTMKSKTRPQYHRWYLKTFYYASCHRSEALLEIYKNGNKRGGKSWTMPLGSPRMGVLAPHLSHPFDHRAGNWVCLPSSTFVCSSIAVTDTSCSSQLSAFFSLEMLETVISVFKHTVRTFKAFFSIGSISFHLFHLPVLTDNYLFLFINIKGKGKLLLAQPFISGLSAKLPEVVPVLRRIAPPAPASASSFCGNHTSPPFLLQYAKKVINNSGISFIWLFIWTMPGLELNWPGILLALNSSWC